MEHILLLSFILCSVININLASTINQVGTDKKNRFRGKKWTEELRLSWSQPVIPLQLGSICLITSRLPLSVYIFCPLSWSPIKISLWCWHTNCWIVPTMGQYEQSAQSMTHIRGEIQTVIERQTRTTNNCSDNNRQQHGPDIFISILTRLSLIVSMG